MININSLSTEGLYRQYESNIAAASSQSGDYEKSKADDTAVTVKISENVRGKIPELSSSTVDSQNNISYIQATNSSLDSMMEIMGRMNYLSAKSLQAGVDASDRVDINSELTKLKEQLRRVQDEAQNSIDKISVVEMPAETSFDNEESVKNLRDYYSSIEDTLVKELNVKESDRAAETKSLGESLANILHQAGSALMAQANQTNYGVLALLN